MKSVSKWLALAVLGLAIVVMGSARTAEPAPDAAIWGVYTRLVGTTKQHVRSDGYQIRWRWQVPGQVLLQEWVVPATGRVAHADTITPGTTPGTLVLTASYLGGKEWSGIVQGDGSVGYVGRGLLKMPYAVSLSADGVFEMYKIRMQGRVAVRVEGGSYSTFTPVAAAMVAGEAPSMPAASATAQEPAAAEIGPTPSAGGAVAANVASAAPAPAPAATPPAPSTPEELEAQAAELQAKAAALRQAQADAAEGEAAAQAQAEIERLEQVARDAAAAADEAQRKLDEAKALADAADPPAPKPKPWVKGADNRDWWSFCGYGVDGGDSFMTQLIHQRIYAPYDGPAEEYDNYEGPNRKSDVEKRFQHAMETSGLVPQSGGSIGLNCRTFASRDSADYYYKQAHYQDPVPRRVLWLHLEDESIVGSLNLPTLEEQAAMKRAAEEARRQAEAARAAAVDAARREASRQKLAKRKADCKAGVPGTCGAEASRQ
jgi:hypothetical protein